MNKHLFSLATIAIILGSCQAKEQDLVKDGVTAPEIIASVEINPETKSLIEVDELGEGTIYWTPADQINIFYGTTSTLYTSQNTINATTAVFRTTDIIGSTESASTNIWGLYPYDDDATCSGTAVTTTLPAAQYGVPETFDDDLYITLAHSATNALKFFNVCGGIKFSLSRADITAITFKGNNNEDIAGDISLTFQNDLPKATVVNGLKEITLTPKTGATFAQGVNYYLIVLPGTFSGGFTMTFTTADGAIGTFNYTSSAITIKRSIFSKKAEIDTYATFVEAQPSIPEDFNPNTFLIYRANKTEYTSGRDWYSIESHMPGISGAKVELKFQLSEGESKMIASDNRESDYRNSLRIENGCLIWTNWPIHNDDADCFRISIPLSSHSLNETSQMVLFYDSVSSSFSINNVSENCQGGRMSFDWLFAEYYSEYDEGRRTSFKGIPDGSKLFYVKVWDENDRLEYLGYATQSVNPSTNQTEYCWCSFDPLTNVSTYDFANDAIHQGGYSGNTQPMVPDAVDLGLSVKWASLNLGATKPEEYGDYYAWGETEPKSSYSWQTYKWCMGSDNTLTKYCMVSSNGYNGFIDGKTVLDPEDDAANVNLGGNWRMPTDAEWTELRENCTWTWTTQNGVDGRLVTASNGNSIFLPAVGNQYNTTPLGKYWSSSLNTDFPSNAWMVLISSGDVFRSGLSRCDGSWVRPVCVE